MLHSYCGESMNKCWRMTKKMAITRSCINSFPPPHRPHDPKQTEALARQQCFSLVYAHSGLDFGGCRPAARPAARPRGVSHIANRVGTDFEEFALGQKAICATCQTTSGIWKLGKLVDATEKGDSAPVVPRHQARCHAPVPA